MRTEKLEQKKNIKETDYSTYELSKKEKLRCILACLCVMTIISEIFYKSLLPAIIFLALIPFALKKYSMLMLEKRKKKMKKEFIIAMSAYGSALRSGYSAENAIRVAREEAERASGKGGIIEKEFKLIERKLSLRENIEDAFLSLADRSGIEEIENMARVFSISKRYGGSLADIVTNTIGVLKERLEIREEIETMMTAKKLEYRIMCLMPAGILVYVNLTSPDFVAALYTGVIGRVAMSILLAAYIGAIMLGERILKVKL